MLSGAYSAQGAVKLSYKGKATTEVAWKWMLGDHLLWSWRPVWITHHTWEFHNYIYVCHWIMAMAQDLKVLLSFLVLKYHNIRRFQAFLNNDSIPQVQEDFRVPPCFCVPNIHFLHLTSQEHKGPISHIKIALYRCMWVSAFLMPRSTPSANLARQTSLPTTTSPPHFHQHNTPLHNSSYHSGASQKSVV